MQCGGALTPTERVASTPGVAVASPQTYTPRHLAEKILADRRALEGERKQITVLFADLSGSTELIRDLDPEDAQALLDGAVKGMMDAVHRYEGTVNHILGDGIMALFGAPIAHEDHAVRACFASLEIQEGLRRYGEDVLRRSGFAIRGRVGLNSGEVVVRAIANDLRMDYSALGQTVHLAARMEQAAAPGTIVLSPATLAATEGFVQVRPLGPVQVKGLSEPIEVHELVGVGAARTRLQVAAARGLSPLVGRQDELAAIEQALERAQAGRGQVVALVAEPGVGKSRLIWEVTHSPRMTGTSSIRTPSGPSPDPEAPAWTVLEASAIAYGRATSWLPVADLLRGYFCIEGRDDRRAMREKVAGSLRALDPALTPDLPALLALLDVPTDEAEWAALEPPRRRRRTLDAVTRLLLRASRERPLLLVLEDLHWVDSETQALLDELVEGLPTTRAVLLVSYRPEYRHGWGNKTYYTQVGVAPLPGEGAESLLSALVGDDPTLQPLKPLLTARAAGNPFFLEESVRALIETGTLGGERGAYRLARPLRDVQVPATVQAILAARIDRLVPEHKRLLQTAAVIGKDLPLALLRATAELPDEDLGRGLAHLQEAELLYQTSSFPEPEYTFKHAITQEVAYASLLRERRRELHRRVADRLELDQAGQAEPPHALLAHHLVQAEERVRALPHLLEAARRAKRRYANDEALALFGRALAILEAAADGQLADLEPGAARAAIFDLLSERHGVLGVLSRFAEERVDLETMRRLAEADGDDRRLSDALNGLADSYNRGGDLAATRAAAEAALAIKVRLGDKAGEADALSNIAPLYTALGDFDAAKEANRRALRLREEIGDEPGRIRSLDNLGLNYLYVGAAAEARPFFEQALERARAIGYKSYELQAAIHLGFSAVALGATAAGRDHAQRALALAQETGDPAAEGLVRMLMGALERDAGDPARAEAAFTAALELARAAGSVELEVRMLIWSGHGLLVAQRPAEALDRFEQAAERAEAAGFALDVVDALAGAAAAALDRGQTALACERAERAAGHFAAINADVLYEGPAVAWCLYRVFRALGDPRAEAFWEQARATLRRRLDGIPEPEERLAASRRTINRPIMAEESRRIGRKGGFSATPKSAAG